MPRAPLSLNVHSAGFIRRVLDLYEVDLTSDQKCTDNMFLFPRGWAFTSVSPGIKKETPKK
jgi:hypothetical protein